VGGCWEEEVGIPTLTVKQSLFPTDSNPQNYLEAISTLLTWFSIHQNCHLEYVDLCHLTNILSSTCYQKDVPNTKVWPITLL
jgi:hypothetical protein